MDLSALEFSFCPNEQIEEFMESQFAILQDKKAFREKYEDALKNSYQKILGLIEKGELADSGEDSVKGYVEKILQEKKQALFELRGQVQNNLDLIIGGVEGKLQEYIPSWKPEAVAIDFGLSEATDFSVNGNKVFVNLFLLEQKSDYLKTVTEGIAHELVHVWHNEANGEKEQGNGLETLKNGILSGIIREGLAVYISGMDLEKFYADSQREYQSLKTEAFDLFEKILTTDDLAFLETVLENDFKNMGKCYLLGLEIITTLKAKLGEDRFKELVIESRKNPGLMIGEYLKINRD